MTADHARRMASASERLRMRSSIGGTPDSARALTRKWTAMDMSDKVTVCEEITEVFGIDSRLCMSTTDRIRKDTLNLILGTTETLEGEKLQLAVSHGKTLFEFFTTVAALDHVSPNDCVLLSLILTALLDKFGATVACVDPLMQYVVRLMAFAQTVKVRVAVTGVLTRVIELFGVRCVMPVLLDNHAHESVFVRGEVTFAIVICLLVRPDPLSAYQWPRVVRVLSSLAQDAHGKVRQVAIEALALAVRLAGDEVEALIARHCAGDVMQAYAEVRARGDGPTVDSSGLVRLPGSEDSTVSRGSVGSVSGGIPAVSGVAGSDDRSQSFGPGRSISSAGGAGGGDGGSVGGARRMTRSVGPYQGDDSLCGPLAGSQDFMAVMGRGDAIAGEAGAGTGAPTTGGGSGLAASGSSSRATSARSRKQIPFDFRRRPGSSSAAQSWDSLGSSTGGEGPPGPPASTPAGTTSSWSTVSTASGAGGYAAAQGPTTDWAAVGGAGAVANGSGGGGSGSAGGPTGGAGALIPGAGGYGGDASGWRRGRGAADSGANGAAHENGGGPGVQPVFDADDEYAVGEGPGAESQRVRISGATKQKMSNWRGRADLHSSGSGEASGAGKGGYCAAFQEKEEQQQEQQQEHQYEQRHEQQYKQQQQPQHHAHSGQHEEDHQHQQHQRQHQRQHHHHHQMQQQPQQQHDHHHQQGQSQQQMQSQQGPRTDQDGGTEWVRGGSRISSAGRNRGSDGRRSASYASYGDRYRQEREYEGDGAGGHQDLSGESGHDASSGRSWDRVAGEAASERAGGTGTHQQEGNHWGSLSRGSSAAGDGGVPAAAALAPALGQPPSPFGRDESRMPGGSSSSGGDRVIKARGAYDLDAMLAVDKAAQRELGSSVEQVVESRPAMDWSAPRRQPRATSGRRRAPAAAATPAASTSQRRPRHSSLSGTLGDHSAPGTPASGSGSSVGGIQNLSAVPCKEIERHDLQPLRQPETVANRTRTKLLASDDWTENFQGIQNMRALVAFHPELVVKHYGDMVQMLGTHASNERSTLAIAGITCIFEMMEHMGRQLPTNVLQRLVDTLLPRAAIKRMFAKRILAILQAMMDQCSMGTMVKCLRRTLQRGGHPRKVVVASEAVDAGLASSSTADIEGLSELLSTLSTTSSNEDALSVLLGLLVEWSKNKAQEVRSNAKRSMARVLKALGKRALSSALRPLVESDNAVETIIRSAERERI